MTRLSSRFVQKSRHQFKAAGRHIIQNGTDFAHRPPKKSRFLASRRRNHVIGDHRNPKISTAFSYRRTQKSFEEDCSVQM